jgi:hypothetical protein
LLQEVGHIRHAVGRDVFEDLQHLGPFFQMANAEFWVPQGLPDQFLAVGGQARKATTIGPLSGRLRLDLPAGLRSIQLLGREQPQLLIGVMELHLAVAHFERLPVPFAHLLGQPDRVLLGAQDMEHIGGRIDPLAARKIVFGKQPHG